MIEDINTYLWKVIIGWTCVGIFVCTAVALILDILGLRFVREGYRKVLVGALIVEIVVISVGWFGGILNPRTTPVAEKIQALDQSTTLLEQKTTKLEKENKDYVPPTDLSGKFGIALESDADLNDARNSVFEKGKSKGFESVFLFKVKNKYETANKFPEVYRTIAVFDSEMAAKDAMTRAVEVNETAEKVGELKYYCLNAEWIEDGGYFDCISTAEK